MTFENEAEERKTTMSAKQKKHRSNVWVKASLWAVFGVSGLCALSQGAAAETPARMEQAKLVQTIAPTEGFIDDPFEFDNAGSRLLYVNSDTGSTTSLVVVDAYQQTILSRVDISKFSLKPSKVEFAIDGEHYLVWSEEGDDGRKRAAVIDKSGRVLRSFGPALDIVAINYEGIPSVVVHDVTTLKKRKRQGPDQPSMRHSVAIYSVEKGKRLGTKSNLDLNDQNANVAMGFTFRYWAENFTIAVGIKEGSWDPEEGQRTPDIEAWYTMPTKTFSRKLPIANVLEHRKRMARLVKFSSRARDIVVKHNLSGIEYVENGEFKPVTLAEPFHHYDPASLQTKEIRNGRLFFTVTIDPVHPDAAARRKAVKPWVDLYEYTPSTGKAVRRARRLASHTRRYAWEANHEYWAVVPRHIGFDRGGAKLLLYKLK